MNTLDDWETLKRNQSSKSKKPELIKLGKITPGDYFGVSSALEKISSLFTATVSSDEVTLLRITRDRFLKFVKDRQTLRSLREHINRRDKWHVELIAKIMNVTNQFTSKAWVDPKESNEFFETPSPFIKKMEFVVNDENPVILAKFPTPSGIKSTGNSPRVAFAIRPQSSVTNSPRSNIIVANTAKATQELLNSKKFFARTSNTKDYKHGLTYERNQNKLKKIFERERQQKGITEKVRPKLKLVPPERIATAHSQNQLKESSISIVIHRKDESLPSSPERSPVKKDRISSPILLRERFASLSLQKVNSNDILSRRISTDDFKPPSNPSTPGVAGMRISTFSFQPNKFIHQSETPSQKSLTNLPSDAGLSSSFFKKSSTYYNFTQERFNTDDSIDSKQSQSTKRNSFNDLNSGRRVSSAQKEFRLSSFNPKMKA